MKELVRIFYNLDKNSKKIKTTVIRISVEGDEDFADERDLIDYTEHMLKEGLEHPNLRDLVGEGYHEEIIKVLGDDKQKWERFSAEFIVDLDYVSKDIDFFKGKAIKKKVSNILLDDIMGIINSGKLIINMKTISRYTSPFAVHKEIPQFILLKLDYKDSPILLVHTNRVNFKMNEKLLEYKIYEFLSHYFPENKDYRKRFVDLETEFDENKSDFMRRYPPTDNVADKVAGKIMKSSNIIPGDNPSRKLFEILTVLQAVINEGMAKIGDYQSLEEFYDKEHKMIEDIDMEREDFYHNKLGKKIIKYTEKLKKKNQKRTSPKESTKRKSKGRYSRKREPSLSEESSSEESSSEKSPRRKSKGSHSRKRESFSSEEDFSRKSSKRKSISKMQG